MNGLVLALKRTEDFVMVGALLTAFVLGCAQVIMRYIFDTGEIWIEGISVDLTIFAAMMGGSRAVAIRSHVRVGFFVDWLPHRILRWFNLLVIAISIFYCGFILYASTLFVQFVYSAGIISINTGLPSWVEFSITPLAMTFFLIRYLLLIPDTWRGTLQPRYISAD